VCHWGACRGSCQGTRGCRLGYIVHRSTRGVPPVCHWGDCRGSCRGTQGCRLGYIVHREYQRESHRCATGELAGGHPREHKAADWGTSGEVQQQKEPDTHRVMRQKPGPTLSCNTPLPVPPFSLSLALSPSPLLASSLFLLLSLLPSASGEGPVPPACPTTCQAGLSNLYFTNKPAVTVPMKTAPLCRKGCYNNGYSFYLYTVTSKCGPPVTAQWGVHRLRATQ